jgi:hypothetical protein
VVLLAVLLCLVVQHWLFLSQVVVVPVPYLLLLELTLLEQRPKPQLSALCQKRWGAQEPLCPSLCPLVAKWVVNLSQRCLLSQEHFHSHEESNTGLDLRSHRYGSVESYQH